MRISDAARRLGTSARMLRYREELGLLPQVRDQPGGRAGAVGAGAATSGAGARTSRAGVTAPRAAGTASRAGATADASGAGAGAAHRQFSEADLEAVAAALDLERRYDISPASLAFGLRVLAEPSVRMAVADLGRRLGRLSPTPGRALDFEKERALRLLSRG
jgi:MerR family transcriptional regulator, copper efflux regulator